MSRREPLPLIEAAQWRMRLAEAELESSAAFEAWLASDSRNAAAWKAVQAPWELVGEQSTSPEIIELRRAALAHAQEARRSPAHRPWLKQIAAAAALLVVVIGAAWIWKQTQPDVYRTAAGERRVVTLADGSQVALDSQSEVKVRYSTNARELVLASGQARFDVAHDVERPFSVSARGHKVIATGTAFNVDLFGPTLLVTLIEGHVIVLSDTAADEIRVSQVGEQLALSPVAAPSVARVNLERATSWENGEIIFENDPLSAVVSRLNRYTQNPIVLDPATAEMRISGVFHTGDIDGFVSTIVSYLPVEARKDADGTTVLAHRR
jgi:transmembrane sensor